MTPSDYTLAWICALPIELAAATAMLDETHRPAVPAAHNTYILGQIQGHNIVIACLPSGVYGLTSATAVISHLRSDFPNIRYGVMVGIGGGVPSKTADVRLGDVIVSKPTGTSGGVIHYDFGKAIDGGHFQHTGMLNQPPSILLTAVSQLQARRMTRRDMTATFSRPSDDRLFSGTYKHLHPDRSCMSCDIDQQITRTPRSSDEPEIHYGIIASGNQVVKDAHTRDQIAKKLGALCFEMEAAGIMNHLPCLVIRGICDYCDSHKNKEWQGYAALTAAAYTKELLSVVPLPTSKDVSKLTAVPTIEDFIGRQDDLDRLWDYIQPASSQPRKVAILHGLGGIGKTQLAIRFARMHKKDFTAIFWLSGKDRSALVQSLSSCLPRIQGELVDMEATTEEKAEQRAIQVLQWLAIPSNTDWLLIFDNVDQYSPLQDVNQSGYDISQFFPKADHGSILITSRLQRLTQLGKSFPVQKLAATDAIQLLLQSSGLPAEDNNKDATDLTRRLDGLPLAIVIAGAFMRETGMTVREYLQYYENSWFDLQSQSGPMRYYQQGNILETWTVSYHEVQKRDPTAAALLLFLACFDNRDIWYELIRSGYDRYDYGDIADWFHTAASNKLAFMTTLKTLIGFSLIEINHQEGSYAMHPVVQDWCLHVAATENRLIQLKELALISVGYMVINGENYARLQRLLPHANYLLRAERCNWSDNNPAIWKAFSGLGSLYLSQAMPKKAEEMYQCALTGFEKALGSEDTFPLDILSNLGVLYARLNRLKEAEEMYQRALTGSQKELGPDHPSTLSIVNNLGMLYVHRGRLKEAEEMYQRVIIGKEKAPGPDHISTLKTINNLGHLYERQGRLKEAEEAYQRALTGYKKAFGPDYITRLPTLHTSNALGGLYHEQGRLKEAAEMYQQALTGFEKVLSTDHVIIRTVKKNLVSVSSSIGRDTLQPNSPPPPASAAG
ncbi:hypothetical protein CDV55_102182 [Aspergillus turcosus]|nr:hypothetical protein CDV55_102182 [Aspergillus turcosus]